MDIDGERLDRITAFAEEMAERGGVDPTIRSTTDRREAVRDAEYVVTMFYHGWEGFEQEIQIPLDYGVDQAIGNMINPSGVFAAQRNIPVILDVARDMEELCPDATLLNYTNPVPALSWAVDEATDIEVYGLCHSVQNTARELANYLGIPVEELEYWVAGINHMAWFLQLEHDGRDLYPALFEAMDEPEIYEQDTVRFEILRHFGAFVTESSAHMSEYVPYFRTDPALVEELAGEGMAQRVPTAYYLEQRQAGGDDLRSKLEFDEDDYAIERSHEYGTRIIHSRETGQPRRMNINVRNNGAIANLPDNAVVEVPCLADGTGVHPCTVGELPPQLAALNRTNLDVYELSVEAALERDRDLVRQAIALDPLTSAACTLDEIRDMTDELFEASADYLPEYR